MIARSQLSQRRRDRLTDVGIAVLVLWFTAVQLGSRGFGEYEGTATEPDALGFLLCLALALPLVFRRRVPWASLALTVGAWVVLLALGYAVHMNLGVAVMLYTFASRPDRGRVWSPIGFALLAYVIGTATGSQTIEFNAEDYILPPVLWAAGWLVGDKRRTNRLRAAEEAERRAREQSLQIAEERTRIARDLHDSAGHAINNLLVQAGVARLLHERDPERSRGAIAAIEEVARETLNDIDRIVAALRDGEPAERAPLPGTEAIPALIDHHRNAGFDFKLVERGDGDRPAPQPVERAAYRIAQEALTNAARHGAGGAEIVVERGGDRLTLTVSNPVRARGSTRSGGGLGIVGMRERATLLGGEFHAGLGDRRFVVRAVLPYDRASQ